MNKKYMKKKKNRAKQVISENISENTQTEQTDIQNREPVMPELPSDFPDMESFAEPDMPEPEPDFGRFHLAVRLCHQRVLYPRQEMKTRRFQRAKIKNQQAAGKKKETTKRRTKSRSATGNYKRAGAENITGISATTRTAGTAN